MPKRAMPTPRYARRGIQEINPHEDEFTTPPSLLGLERRDLFAEVFEERLPVCHLARCSTRRVSLH